MSNTYNMSNTLHVYKIELTSIAVLWLVNADSHSSIFIYCSRTFDKRTPPSSEYLQRSTKP